MQFPSTLSGILGILLIFNGAVFVHEWGHFLAARWRGLKVDRFSIFGLGPALFQWKGKSGVTYCICALPFGAFVSIPQMVNPSSLETSETTSPEHLPVATTIDKIIIASAGPVFNILFALVLATIVWWQGHPVRASFQTTTVGYVPETIAISDHHVLPSPAYLAGLQPGDKIIAIDQQPVADFRDIIEAIALGSQRTPEGDPFTVLTIKRGEDRLDIDVFPALVRSNPHTQNTMRKIGIFPSQTLRVGHVFKNSPAKQAGVLPQDVIVAVDGWSIYHFQQLNDRFQTDAVSFALQVRRQGSLHTYHITPVNRPLTKPFLSVSLPSDDGASMECIPYDARHMSPEEATDPATNTSLLLFQLPKSSLKNPPPSKAVLHAVNGQSIPHLQALSEAFRLPAPWVLTWKKDQKIGTSTLPAGTRFQTVRPTFTRFIGIQHSPELIITHPTPISQIKSTFQRTFRTLSSLVHPQSNIGLSQLSGPLGIGRLIYRLSTAEQYAWQFALAFAVFLNINLAVLNLLPIPVLDGGHITIALLNKILRRDIPEKWIAFVQGSFAVIFIFIMVYVLFQDTLRWSGDHTLEAEQERLNHHYIPTSPS